MDQIRQLWDALTTRQRFSLLAAVAVAGFIWLAVRWNEERDLRPLFTNLSAEDAGALVEKLKSGNVEYKVADNGTILVHSSRVAEMRIEMAAAGLPRTGRIGFELFDKTNLGSSEFAEQVNYRRALEGELERSVMSLSEVERARVHVTFAKDSVFLESRQPAKASVMVKLRPAARLSAQNVQAIQHLASSAVEGLSPESVSVLDMSGNLLGKPRRDLDSDAQAGSAAQEYRQSIEREYLAKVKATLDPLLGEDKYRVGVNVECDFTSGEQSEESYDPNRSVMATSQRTEDATTGASTGGVPGTASNLPRPLPRASAAGAGVARKTESITYQTSRVVKHLKLPQGTLKRLSAAVLVDYGLRWDGTGPQARRVLEPPSAERLKGVRDILAGVVGFNQERGDQLLVEALPFEATIQAPPPEAPGKGSSEQPGVGPPGWAQPYLRKAPLGVWLGAGGALLAVLLVCVGLVVRRIIPRKRHGRGELEAGPPRIPASAEAAAVAAGHQDKSLSILAESVAERERLEREAIASLQLPPQTTKSEILRKVISQQAEKEPAAVAKLVRTWLAEQHL